MKIKLALSLIVLSVSSVFASDFVRQTDEERLEAALRLSIETARAAEAFRAKQAEMTATSQASVGKVAFQRLFCDAGVISGNSMNPDEIQRMINQVREIQRKHTLTVEQAEDADRMLVSLATRMSQISTAQQLGAAKKSSS